MKKIMLAAALLAATLPTFAHAAEAAGVDAQSASVLAAVRGAMLHRPLASVTSLHLTGSMTAAGMSGTYEEWDDVQGQRFAVALTGGPLTGKSGWDGHSAWVDDGHGQVHVDAGNETRLQSIDQAYLDNLGFLAPDADGGTVIYGGQKTDAGHTYDILKVTPAGGSEFDFWIDSSTHLITKEIGTLGLTTMTATLSNYQTSDRITFPRTLTLATSDGNSQAIALTAVDANADVSSHVGVPASSNHDASIAGGDSTTVPIQVINNHIYVHLDVNGKGPFNFILDTGGVLTLSPELAATLKTASAGSQQIGGVGNTTEAAGFTHIDSLQIGNATIRDQYALVLPIDQGFGVAEGLHIDGMISYETVARFLTTIDYANATLTLAPFTDAPATAPGATAIPFFFDGTIPNVPIAIDGATSTGVFDTGSRAALTLTSPFVAAHPALAADETTADGVVGFGIGGPSMGKLGRVNALQIGPFTLAHPIVAFGTQTQGGFADPLSGQNIGGDIWKRFTVTFDYAHSQVLLAPNATFAKPFAYDRSGLFLIDQAGAHVVLGVRAGTPAAKAGLARGDALVGIDGKPASAVTLAQLRTIFMGKPGTVIHLRVKNKAGQHDATLTLHDYV